MPGLACGGFSSLRVLGNRVVREASGASVLGVKFQAEDVFVQRPARDLDTIAAVDLDLSDPAASRAGLVLRALAPDAAYRVEVDKATGLVDVVALTTGAPQLLDAWPLPAPTDTPRLEVEVTGGAPAVSILVRIDGVDVGTTTDATWRYTGTLTALSASDSSSSGEAWDDFMVGRRPDVFAVVRFPAGADAGLPLDVSDHSVISEALLSSTDGVSWQPRPVAPGCFNPGNPFVQLEVEEVTSSGLLFENEAHVVAVELDCATCRLGENECSENGGIAARRQPVPTVGEPLTVRIGWWNEHLSDADRLLMAITIWDAPCSSATAAPLQTQWLRGADLGQLSSGPELRWADTLSFAPTMSGPHCITVEEYHDLNDDCCPDGFEQTPVSGAGCPGLCTPVAASDSNPSTWVVLRDVQVEAPCTAPEPPNLDGASLRVTRPAGEALATTLTWDVLDPARFPARFHVHAMEAGRFDPDLCFHEVAPVIASPLGVTSRTLDLLAPASGWPLWLALFETDGCAGGASIPDDSLTMDPAVLCSP